LKGVSDKSSHKIDSKVSRLAMPGMLNLRDIFELVVNEEPSARGRISLSLTEQELIFELY
jgi:hypothetical protein